jgi:hypothetical protein
MSYYLTKKTNLAILLNTMINVTRQPLRPGFTRMVGNLDRGREQGVNLAKSSDELASVTKSSKKGRHAYAIVRIDEFLGTDVPTERRVTVKKVMRDADAAEKESARLNSLQRDNGVHYFTQTTRLENSDQFALEGGQTNRISIFDSAQSSEDISDESRACSINKARRPVEIFRRKPS